MTLQGYDFRYSGAEEALAVDTPPTEKGNATAPAVLSVLVVDDDALVREWVGNALRGAPDFRLAGAAASALEAETMVARRRPDLLVLDYRLPDEPGTELVRRLRAKGWTMPALLITSTAHEGLNEAAIEAGAQGMVVKRADAGELLRELRQIASGGRVYEPAHPRRGGGHGALSHREREVLQLAATGLSTSRIGAELGITAETVKTLLKRAYGKLGAANRAEAISAAYELGLF